MKEPTLRKWHRNIGIPLIPLILLQAVSGIFLSLEWLTGLHHAASRLLLDTGPVLRFWDWFFLGVHYGGGNMGHFLNVVIGLGILWLGVSGVWIFIKARGRTHNH